MKNSIPLLAQLFFISIVAFFSYKTFNDDINTFSKSKYIKELNTTLFLQNQKTFPMLKDFSYIWGIKMPKKTIEKKKKANDKKKKKKTLKITKKKNQICVDKNCYRFLGLYYKKDKLYITFYSKKFKKRIKDFSLGEELVKPLYLKEFKENRLYIKDKQNNKTWYFDFFNVNTKKYKPKDINESNF